MYETGTHARSATGKLLKVISECIRECAGRHAGRRVDHKPGWFVYDDESLIFVNNFDGDILGNESVCGWRDQLDFNFVILPKLVRRFRALAVYENIFVLDQALQARSTPALDL